MLFMYGSFLNQFMKKAFSASILILMQWQWNTDLILQMNVSGNVVELMTSFILKLPEETLELLKIASGIGNTLAKELFL